MIKTDRLVAVELGPTEFFEYLADRVVYQAERAWIDSVMVPGVLGDYPEFYTFWLGIDQIRELIVCEFYFKGEPNQVGEVEIGYQVIPQFANMGYTSEMVGLMCDIARGMKDVKTLFALVREDNEYSRKIMIRNNFKQRSSITWHKKL